MGATCHERGRERKRSALAQGIRAMLPHVDEFRPVHNLDALADLCASLSATSGRAIRDPRYYLNALKAI